LAMLPLRHRHAEPLPVARPPNLGHVPRLRNR
jgi:hypothetical protein